MVAKKKPSLVVAFIPVLFLIGALAFNVLVVFGDDAVSGANQIILMTSGIVAGMLALTQGVSFETIFEGIAKNIKDTSKALLILLMIGALSGAWMISGVIPAFIYYGLQVLNADLFLPVCIVISAVVSLATGSSWSTTATIGLALMGIGTALGISPAMTAGAVISGAYFGDKMSPLSDTTNLAPAMAGTDLFTHIRYMAYTTIPSISITLIVFTIIGLTLDTSALTDGGEAISLAIADKFNISGWLFLVPLVTLTMIYFKIDAVLSIFAGSIAGGVFALIFQPQILQEVVSASEPDALAMYKGVMISMYDSLSLSSSNATLSELLNSKGMIGMLPTIWLIISAMMFGGAMEAAGFLKRITESLLSLAHNTASLIGTTLVTCGILNVTASDQYLAIVVPGRMFRDTYRDRGLAPQNLSRSLEDSGTVTSVLIPWNTCGAYQSSVLGVATGDYFLYAMFNWLSPLMSYTFALFGIKIAKLSDSEEKAEERQSE